MAGTAGVSCLISVGAGAAKCSYSGLGAGWAAPRAVVSAYLVRSRAASVSDPEPRPADRLNGFSGGAVREKGQWKQHGLRQNWHDVSGRSADRDVYCVGEEEAS